MRDFHKIREEAAVTEANWTVKFKPTKVNGIKVDSKPITVKARASGEAIIKAAKTLGIDKKSSSIMNATVDLDEAVNESVFSKKVFKIWFGKSVQEIIKDAQKLSDKDLVLLGKKANELPPAHSARNVQVKAIEKEMKRRWGVVKTSSKDLKEALVTEAADNSEKKKDEKALQAQLKVIKKKKVVLNKVEAQAEKAYNASEKYKADTEKLSDELWVLMASYDEDRDSFKAYYGKSFKEAVEVAE
jgi:hypothetical protein